MTHDLHLAGPKTRAHADVAAERTCLRCRSDGFGQRICARCKATASWRNAVPGASGQGRRRSGGRSS